MIKIIETIVLGVIYVFLYTMAIWILGQLLALLIP